MKRFDRRSTFPALLLMTFATFPYCSAPLLQAVGQGGSHASVHSNPPLQMVIKSSSSTNVG